MNFSTSTVHRCQGRALLPSTLRACTAGIAALSLFLAPLAGAAETPRQSVTEKRVEQRYAEHLRVLKLADPQARIEIVDFLEMPAAALDRATLGDLFVDADWRHQVQLDVSLAPHHLGEHGPTSATAQAFAQRKAFQARPALDLPLATYLESHGLGRVSRLASFQVRLTLNGDTEDYAALAAWNHDADNRRELRFLDHVLGLEDHTRTAVSLTAHDAAPLKSFSSDPGLLSPNASAVMGHTIPSQMACGEKVTATVTLRNTGSNSWTQALCYKLGAYQDSDPFFDFNPRWDLPTKSAISTSQTVTFSFDLEAPDTAGTYTTDWRMISQVSCGGLGWFGPVVAQDVEVACDEDVDSVSFITDTFPSAMACGETRDVTVTVRNTGNTTWTAAGGYAMTTLENEVFRPTEPRSFAVPHDVEPQDLVTFTLPLEAPALPGGYVSTWRMSSADSLFGLRLHKPIDVVCSLGELRVVDPDGNEQSETVPYDLGGVALFSLSDLPFSICNDGDEAMGISPKGGPIFVAGPGFSSYQDPEPWVDPGECTTLGVRFTATQAGTFTGTAQFYSTDREEPFTFQITAATGPSDLRVTDALGNVLSSGDTLSFQAAVPGSTTKTLNLCAVGPTPIVINNATGLVIDPGPSGAFQQVSVPDDNLTYPECTSFEVRFQANQTENVTGRIVIESNAHEPNFILNLSGSGT